MGTQSDDTPSPRAARETLRQLGEDASAVRYPPIPRWFFAAQSVLVGGLCLAQLLPSPGGAGVAVLCALAMVLLGQRYWLNRDGVSWVTPNAVDMLPFMAVILGTFVLCWVLSDTTGATWVWAVGAVVAGGVVWRTGQQYREEFGDGA